MANSPQSKKPQARASGRFAVNKARRSRHPHLTDAQGSRRRLAAGDHDVPPGGRLKNGHKPRIMMRGVTKGVLQQKNNVARKCQRLSSGVKSLQALSRPQIVLRPRGRVPIGGAPFVVPKIP